MNMSAQDLYDVFIRRDESFAALVFMGVTSTGVFCRPGCPARLPKFENCVFYPTAADALANGYRACKRCHPTRRPGEAPQIVRDLIALVESDPEKPWREVDIKAAGFDPSTARRQFKARFDMTFTDYARRRRMGRANKALSKGDKVIDAQLSAGYESPSGFREAFAKTFGQAPKNRNSEPLLIEWIDTPLGPMVAICDESALFLLEFTNRNNMQRQLERLSKKQGRAIVPGRTAVTDKIESEITAYFEGRLTDFQTPLHTTGTDFQNRVWQQLCEIPFGETRSYSELADMVGNEKAVRAVASSNANNGLAIIIPCHRVIAKGGSLGGYAGGLDRKTWLLDHERKFKP